MWIGTYGGLNRYDGYSFRVFRAMPGDNKSISHNHVTCVSATPDGSVWVGTKTGLNRWDPKTEEFTLYRHDADDPASLPDDFVLNLAVDADGAIWIGTHNGLARYDRSQDEFKVYLHDPANPRSIVRNHLIWLFSDPSGRIWIGPNREAYRHLATQEDNENTQIAKPPVVHRYNPETDDFDTFTIPIGHDGIIKHMGVVPGGRMLFTSVNNGIFEFDSKTESIIPTNDPVLEDFDYIRTMFCASDGTIYVVNEEGMLQYNTLTGEQIFHVHDPNNELSIYPSDNITDIFEDESGLIWIGSNAFGFATLSKTRYKFAPVQCEVLAGDRTNAQYVRRVEADDAGGVWIASADDVLHHYDDKGESKRHHRFDSPVYALRKDDSSGSLWIGCEKGDLFRLNPDSEQAALVINLGGKINDIDFDPQGKMVVFVERRGLLIIEAANSGGYTITPYSEYIDSENYHGGFVFFDSRGRMWLSGEDSGVAMLETPVGPVHKFRFSSSDPSSISNDSVSNFLESADGAIWVATFGGLNRYIPENNNFERITRADGLPEDLIFCLEEDEEGILWLGTSNGMVTYDPDSKQTNIYTVADGLQSNEFNTRASCRLSDGMFVFGGIKGFNRFDPMRIPVNTHEPPIVVTSIRVSGERRKFDLSEVIELPNDDNFITFDFAALDYNNPQENHYAYLLEGFHEDWHYAGTQHSVSYHLSPGDYRLRAKAANSDGVWSEQEVIMQVSILPAFWQTWWFNIGVLFSLLAIVLIWHVVRNRRIQRRADQLGRLNQQLETQMEEISSLNVALNTFDYSVSNALRTPIRHIKFFNETLLEELDSFPSDKIKEYAKRTNEKADNLIDLIDALLTLSRAKKGDLRKEEINLSGIARKIAKDLAEDGSQEVELDLQEGITCSADLQLISILMTNLIANALRFSQESDNPRVEIGCRDNNRRVYFVRDNGVGISHERLGKVMEPFHAYHTDNTFEGIGLGLATCKLIVERHDGEIWIDSEEGTGTTVYFTLGK